MKIPFPTIPAALFLSALATALPSRAALIDNAVLLDFGTNNTTTTSTASPWRNSQNPDPLGASGYDNWNNIGASTTYAASSLKSANNTTASTLTLRIGTDSSVTGLTFSSPSVNASSVVGSAATSLFNNSVTKDAIFTSGASAGGTAAANRKGVGVQIGGLAAGTYDIYIVARNTNNSDTSFGQQASAYVSSSAVDTLSYSQSGLTTAYIANSTNVTSWTASTSFTAGSSLATTATSGNYALLSVTISSTSDYLNIFTLGMGTSGSPDYRGFLNSIEIVPTSLAAIPEPSTYALIGGAGILGLVLCTRRKRA